MIACLFLLFIFIFSFFFFFLDYRDVGKLAVADGRFEAHAVIARVDGDVGDPHVARRVNVDPWIAEYTTGAQASE